MMLSNFAFFLILAIFLALIILYFYIKFRHNYWARQGIAQLKPNLIFGDHKALILGQKPILEFYRDLYFKGLKQGHKVLGVYSGWLPELLPIDLDLIKMILIKDHAYFSSHGMYNHKSDILTLQMFHLEGQEWKDRRTKLSPIFTSGKIKAMFDTVEFIARGIEKASNLMRKNDEFINIKDLFSRYTVDVITTVAFGLDVKCLENKEHEFLAMGQDALTPRLYKFFLESIIPYKFLAMMGHTSFPQIVAKYLKNVINESITYREKNNVHRKDFLQLMMQLQNSGTVDEDQKQKHFIDFNTIVSESFLIFIAGFETSASTLTFAITELAKHSDLQEKLREEILTVLQRNGNQLTFEAMEEMAYLEQVIKETLRIYPAVTILPRKCTKTYKIPGTNNAIIEKEMRLKIAISGLHMNPEFFPDPDRFDPERFSPENKESFPKMAYMPFGDGPRQCIGMRFAMVQIKLGIINFVRNFEFALHESMKLPLLPKPGSVVYALVNDPLVTVKKL